MQKNILAINDISCFGKCSLTVALPIISACGHTASVIPTAILSTHTGGFEGYTFHTTSSEILPIARHWKSLDIKFDAIYTGYLGDIGQIELVKQIIDMFKEKDTVVLVDPVMGDHGKFYSIFDQTFAMEMAELCKHADLITPNLTEAAFLCNHSFADIESGKITVESLAQELKSKLNVGVAITGILDREDEIGVLTLKKESETPHKTYVERVKDSLHGTGDIFASAFISLLAAGKSWEEASEISAKFLLEAIKFTLPEKIPSRNGLAFEKALPYLIEHCK